MAKLPVQSLVVVPMVINLPSGPVAVNVTGTPASPGRFIDGLACCIYKYSIQVLMNLSDMAGVSLAPGDWSVTEPSISAYESLVRVFGDAVTVVALGPLPKA